MAKAGAIEVEIKLNGDAEARVRAIAREEVASLCGLILRRTQEIHAAKPHHLEVPPAAFRQLAEVFGEALRDFSQTPTEPGQAAED